jgi:hypothetical protein
VLVVCSDDGILAFEVTAERRRNVVFRVDPGRRCGVVEVLVGSEQFVDDDWFAQLFSGDAVDGVESSLVLQYRSAGDEPLSVDHIDSRVTPFDGGEPNRTSCGASSNRW